MNRENKIYEFLILSLEYENTFRKIHLILWLTTQKIIPWKFLINKTSEKKVSNLYVFQ